MSKLSSGASYINRESAASRRVKTQKKSPFVMAISGFFALLIALLSIQPILAGAGVGNNTVSSPHYAEAGAAGLFCVADTGLFMDEKSGWVAALQNYPHGDKDNRTWTGQEIFNKGMRFVTYEGEGGSEDNNVITKKEFSDENKKIIEKTGNYSEVSSKLNGVRSTESCGTAVVLNAIATVILTGSNVSSTVVQNFVVFSFSSNIICDDPDNPGMFCLNLLEIIGGKTNSNGGIIGAMTNSIFMPLLVIAVAISAGYVAHKGIVKRQFREAFGAALWVALSSIAAIILLLNPMLLARAPMAVSNVVATCVIGSFNGDNCLTGSTGNGSLLSKVGSTTSDNICISSADVPNIDEQMSMTVNALSCSIWKAFVLEPYAQGSFGTSFANLDVASKEMSEVLKKANIPPETFCVNLTSTESLDSFVGKTLILNGGPQICNILTYQMYLQVNAHSSDDPISNPGAIDPRWYNIIVTAANDEGLWHQWAPSFTGSLHKIGIATMSVFTGIMGSIVLVVVSIFALIYYFSAIILMAFAPLFLLLGVHPGQGKKLLLGWVEQVVSNVVKYITSAIFLIISIAIYSAVIGNANNIGLTLVLVLIITGALLMYRREIIDMIGKVSMGGQQLSSKFADNMKKRVKAAAGIGAAGVGSSIGAGIAAGGIRKGFKDGSIKSGFADGIKRELKRSGTADDLIGKGAGKFVTNATRQLDRSAVDNVQDLKLDQKTAQNTYESSKEREEEVHDEYLSTATEIELHDSAVVHEDHERERLLDVSLKVEGLENEAAREMMEENPYFAQAQLLANQIAELGNQRKLALLQNDPEKASALLGEMNTLRTQRGTLLQDFTPEDLDRNNAEYKAILDDKLDRAGLEFSTQDRNSLEQLIVKHSTADEDRAALVDRANELASEGRALDFEFSDARIQSERLAEFDKARQPGEVLTSKRKDDLYAEIAEAQAKAREEIIAEHGLVDSKYSDFLHETSDEIIAETNPNSSRGNGSGDPNAGGSDDSTDGGDPIPPNGGGNHNGGRGPIPPIPPNSGDNNGNGGGDNTSPPPPNDGNNNGGGGNTPPIPPNNWNDDNDRSLPEPTRSNEDRREEHDSTPNPLNNNNKERNTEPTPVIDQTERIPTVSRDLPKDPSPTDIPKTFNVESQIFEIEDMLPDLVDEAINKKVSSIDIPDMPTYPPKPSNPPITPDDNSGPSGGIPVAPVDPTPRTPNGGQAAPAPEVIREGRIPTRPTEAPKTVEKNEPTRNDRSGSNSAAAPAVQENPVYPPKPTEAPVVQNNSPQQLGSENAPQPAATTSRREARQQENRIPTKPTYSPSIPDAESTVEKAEQQRPAVKLPKESKMSRVAEPGNSNIETPNSDSSSRTRNFRNSNETEGTSRIPLRPATPIRPKYPPRPGTPPVNPLSDK